jgi:hypothetical protein
MFRTLLTASLCLFAVTVSAQDATFKDVKQYITKGDKTREVKATLTISDDALTVTPQSEDSTIISVGAITGATYDRRERQRKTLGLPVTGQGMAGVATKRQHFLTIQFKRGETGDFVELELGKDIAPRVVAMLEAKWGKSIEKVGG